MFNVISLTRLIGSSIVFCLHLYPAKVFNFTRCIERENCFTVKVLNLHQSIIIAYSNNFAHPHDCALRVLQSKSLYACFSFQNTVVTICTTCLNIKNAAFCPYSAFVSNNYKNKERLVLLNSNKQLVVAQEAQRPCFKFGTKFTTVIYIT
jgi:hypothetical protein